jgi:lysozyme family protein
MNGQQKGDLRVPILISKVDLRLIKHNMQAFRRKELNNGLILFNVCSWVQERSVRKEISDLFKSSRENLEWFKNNYDHLKKNYDKCWVIITQKKVVESSSNFDEVLNVAKKYDPSSIIVEFIESEPIAMFF